MRTSLHRVANRTPDRTDGSLAIETAENIAGTKTYQQPIDLRQHVGGEERNGHGITVFQIMTHLSRQIGAHLLQGVPVAGLKPRGEPRHTTGVVTPDHASGDGLHLAIAANRAAQHIATSLPRIKAQPLTVRQGHFLFLAEHEARLHILDVHIQIGAHKHATMGIGKRHLRKVIPIGEDAQGESTPPRGGQLRPSQHQSLGNIFQGGERTPLDHRAQRHRMLGQFIDDAALALAGLAQRIAKRVGAGLTRLG